MSRSAFTLIELLVVLVIIGIVSFFGVQVLFPMFSHRHVSEGARILQGAIAAARDEAVRTGSPSGIRLMPDSAFSGIDPATGLLDPTRPLAASRLIPLVVPPNYNTGAISMYPADVYSPAIRTVNGASDVPCLVIEESPGQWLNVNPPPLPPLYKWQPNEPANWAWNIRVGEQLTVGPAKIYTIVGPMTNVVDNPELCVNTGLPGTVSPLQRTYTSPDGVSSIVLNPGYLLVVNGRDDDRDGYIDEGYDGVDNDADGLIDELDEWEVETWL